MARRWLLMALALIWLPLVMAGGSLLLARSVVAPAFIALLSLTCLFASLVLLWLGIFQIIKRQVRVGDLVVLALYGIGAVLYSQLLRQLSP